MLFAGLPARLDRANLAENKRRDDGQITMGQKPSGNIGT